MPDAEEVLAPAGGRGGHFLLESGGHTDLWLDLESLLVPLQDLIGTGPG